MQTDARARVGDLECIVFSRIDICDAHIYMRSAIQYAWCFRLLHPDIANASRPWIM